MEDGEVEFDMGNFGVAGRGTVPGKPLALCTHPSGPSKALSDGGSFLAP
jgi:hypothetical protein